MEDKTTNTTETEVITPEDVKNSENKEKELQDEVEKYKRLLSKANSEASDYKKQLRARQTADEIAEEERIAKQTALENELAELKNANAIAELTAEYISMGYSPEVARQNAEYFRSGNHKGLFANEIAFVEGIKKNAVATAIDKQSGLTTGNPVAPDNDKASTDALRKAFGLN